MSTETRYCRFFKPFANFWDVTFSTLFQSQAANYSLINQTDIRHTLKNKLININIKFHVNHIYFILKSYLNKILNLNNASMQFKDG